MATKQVVAKATAAAGGVTKITTVSLPSKPPSGS